MSHLLLKITVIINFIITSHFYLQDLFSIVASILHLGNINFSEEDGSVWVKNPTEVQNVSSVSRTYLCFNKYPTMALKGRLEKYIVAAHLMHLIT